MNPLYIEVLGAIVRWLMTLAGSYLVAHHVLTTDQADSLTSDVVKHAILAAPLAVPLAWSIWHKARSNQRLSGVLTALDDAVRANRGAARA